MVQEMQVYKFEEGLKRAKLEGRSEAQIKFFEEGLEFWKKALEAYNAQQSK
jgi:hypothetical protein